MKFRDMPQAAALLEKGYIHERWNDHQRSVKNSFRRIVEYLFLLNTGGVVATATYIATKPTSISDMKGPMWLFIAGVIFITFHAVWDYYRCLLLFKRYRENVLEFVADKIEWEVLVDRDAHGVHGEWVGHVLGWLSGTCFVFGVIRGGFSIIS
ncbi:MAG: hypothetical protein QOI07_53 [Verrucomicrobiota bacterium]|jgi:hypothetical protein